MAQYAESELNVEGGNKVALGPEVDLASALMALRSRSLTTQLTYSQKHSMRKTGIPRNVVNNIGLPFLRVLSLCSDDVLACHHFLYSLLIPEYARLQLTLTVNTPVDATILEEIMRIVVKQAHDIRTLSLSIAQDRALDVEDHSRVLLMGWSNIHELTTEEIPSRDMASFMLDIRLSKQSMHSTADILCKAFLPLRTDKVEHVILKVDGMSNDPGVKLLTGIADFLRALHPTRVLRLEKQVDRILDALSLQSNLCSSPQRSVTTIVEQANTLLMPHLDTLVMSDISLGVETKDGLLQRVVNTIMRPQRKTKIAVCVIPPSCLDEAAVRRAVQDAEDYRDELEIEDMLRVEQEIELLSTNDLSNLTLA
jgi:hypothetical protein